MPTRVLCSLPSRFLCFLIVLATLSFHAPRAAAAIDWDPVTDAEKSMKSNPLDPGAGAVVLFKRGQIDVIERSSLFWTTRITTYVRIKIFNDAGRDFANRTEESPKYVRTARVEGRTIQPSGEIIPMDSSKVFHGTVYQEGKRFAVVATKFTLPSVEPGSIVEYQIEENEDWFYPAPWIFDTSELGTLQSTLKVTIGPRLSMAQFPLETTQNRISVSQSESVRGSQYDFSVTNLRPIVSEPFAPAYRDLATMIIFTPRQLGFGGDVYPIITKWDDVGERIKTEVDDMAKNSKEARNRAKEIAEKIPEPRKKAEAIYAFLQQNIQSNDVVGIALGRPADEILSAKRGDPDEINALYFLMLKEAKIDADLVLVATQNWQTLIRAFPNRSQFARIVTRINLKDGPVFTDPADSAAPFGWLPWYECGITGMAVKGSKLQETAIPAGTVDDNISTATSTMRITKDWYLEGDQEVDIKGAEAIEFRSEIMGESPERAEHTLTEYFEYGNAESQISNLSHPDFRDSSQPLVLKAHVKVTNHDLGQDGLLLNPWLGDQYERPLFKTTARHSAVRFYNPEKRTMTTTWQLAPEIKVEQLPKDAKIETDLGSFSHSCAQKDSTIVCTRMYSLKKTLLQKNTEYLDAKKFFDDIAKQDQEIIVLREN